VRRLLLVAAWGPSSLRIKTPTWGGLFPTM